MKKQTSGLYRTKVRVGKDPEGNPVDKWLSARTKADLETKKRALTAGYVGGYDPAAVPLFGQAVISWYKTVKEPFVSKSSKVRYKTVINHYVLPGLADRRLSTLTRADVQKAVNRLTGMSSTMAKQVMYVFTSVIRQAVSDGYIIRDITLGVVMPKANKTRGKRALTASERIQVEELAKTRPWLAVLYYTGMRSGEMRALTWADIDLKHNVIHITKAMDNDTGITEGKTAAAIRDVPIPTPLHRILAHFTGMPSAYVTGCAWSANTIRKQFDRLRLPEDITPHCLRHNYITMCWEAGLDAIITSKLVGHVNPTVTLNIYTHLENDTYVDQVNDVFSKVAQKLHKTKTGV